MESMKIVLDNIRSAFNVGSVMRTCDATGCSLVTVGYTPKPLGETKMLIKKTAIRAEDVVPFEHFDHPMEVFSSYPSSKGYLHIAVELFEDAECIYDFMSNFETRGYNLNNIFLWLGNEIHGISPEYRNEFKHLVFLPMVGIKESLNVANTTTAVIYLLKALESKKIINR
jgi:23S rRNA (guanosine2251-2'-O)-methyltransferase